MISRATTFVRRELMVWNNLDREVCRPVLNHQDRIDLLQFLTTFIISLMRSIDIRTEASIKLLAEFLDYGMPYTPGERFPNAEHFAHGARLCLLDVT